MHFWSNVTCASESTELWRYVNQSIVLCCKFYSQVDAPLTGTITSITLGPWICGKRFVSAQHSWTELQRPSLTRLSISLNLYEACTLCLQGTAGIWLIFIHWLRILCNSSCRIQVPGMRYIHQKKRRYDDGGCIQRWSQLNVIASRGSVFLLLILSRICRCPASVTAVTAVPNNKDDRVASRKHSSVDEGPVKGNVGQSTKINRDEIKCIFTFTVLEIGVVRNLKIGSCVNIFAI